MGETQNRPFQLSFNSSLKVDFQGARVTSDGGLILVRELDERLGLSALMERHLTDSRRGKNTQLPLADLLRQSIYSRLAGYEDVNDAERLSQDPAFRLIGSRKICEGGIVDLPVPMRTVQRQAVSYIRRSPNRDSKWKFRVICQTSRGRMAGACDRPWLAVRPGWPCPNAFSHRPRRDCRGNWPDHRRDHCRSHRPPGARRLSFVQDIST